MTSLQRKHRILFGGDNLVKFLESGYKHNPEVGMLAGIALAFGNVRMWEPKPIVLAHRCQKCGGKGFYLVRVWNGLYNEKCGPCAAIRFKDEIYRMKNEEYLEGGQS